MCRFAVVVTVIVTVAVTGEVPIGSEPGGEESPTPRGGGGLAGCLHKHWHSQVSTFTNRKLHTMILR